MSIVVWLRRLKWPGLAAVSALAAIALGQHAGAFSGPPIEQYVAEAGPGARIVKSGKLVLDGYRALCGRRPTVMHPKFDSWGGSYPQYIILNPVALKEHTRAVKLYVYSHECGHVFRGFSEDTADCFAIRRGVRRGWLTAKGMDEICTFISKVRADAAHPPGPIRCERMRKCYRKYTESAQR